jgi:hypothetical protein
LLKVEYGLGSDFPDSVLAEKASLCQGSSSDLYMRHIATAKAASSRAVRVMVAESSSAWKERNCLQSNGAHDNFRTVYPSLQTEAADDRAAEVTAQIR